MTEMWSKQNPTEECGNLTIWFLMIKEIFLDGVIFSIGKKIKNPDKHFLLPRPKISPNKQLQLPYGFSFLVNGFSFNWHNFDVCLFSQPLKSITLLMNFNLGIDRSYVTSLLSNRRNNPSFDSLVRFILNSAFFPLFVKTLTFYVSFDFTIFIHLQFVRFMLNVNVKSYVSCYRRKQSK